MGQEGREGSLLGNRADGRCREIVAQTVCARGQKVEEQIHTIPAASLRSAPEEVLGVRVTSHRCQPAYAGDHVTIRGEYEFQVWVGYTDDSDLVRDQVSYQVDVPLMEIGDGVTEERPELRVDVIEGPTVIEFGLNKEGNVEMVTSLVLRVAVLAETRLFVHTCVPGSDFMEGDEFAEEWDWVEEEDTVPHLPPASR